MKTVKFVGDNPLDYALFKEKAYMPYYETEDSYLIHNEVGNNSTVPKELFVEVYEYDEEDEDPDDEYEPRWDGQDF